MPTHFLSKSVRGGNNCHLGLVNGLLSLIEQSQTTVEHLELQINVDGVSE